MNIQLIFHQALPDAIASGALGTGSPAPATASSTRALGNSQADRLAIHQVLAPIVTAAGGTAASRLPNGFFWGHLQSLKLHIDKSEPLDLTLLHQLRQQWQQTKREIKLAHRASLIECEERPLARHLRQALEILSKGLRQLHRIERDSTHRSKKNRAKTTRMATSLSELPPTTLQKRVDAAAEQCQMLFHQRAYPYQRLAELLMRYRLIKKGWPLDPAINEEGKLLDSRRLLRSGNRSGELLRSSSSLNRALTALRQLWAQLDLYALTLCPQLMEEKEWQSFSLEKLRIATNSLSCRCEVCQSSSGRLSSGQEERALAKPIFIAPDGGLHCEASLSRKKGKAISRELFWPVAWISEFCAELKQLAQELETGRGVASIE